MSLSLNIYKPALVLFFLLNLIQFRLVAQENAEQYQEMWNSVERLMKDGKTSSALEEVKKIEKQGEKDELIGEKTKALIHIMKLSAEKDEDDFLLSLNNIENRIEQGSGIEKALLHSAAAEMYWWYYQSHSYEIWERLPDPNNENPDIRTWDANQIVSRIDEHYWNSLEPEKELLKAKPVDISSVLTPKKDELDLRPSLYDFLIHRAIDFYSSNISGLTYPKDQFYIDSPEYLSDLESFTSIEITEPDYLSLDFKALILYQRLLRIHEREGNKLPLLFSDLERIKFVYSKYSGFEKDELFEGALEHLSSRSDAGQLKPELQFELAQFYFNKGSRYDRMTNPEGKDLKQKAHTICQETFNKYAKSRGTQLCRSLMQQIERKSLNVQLESVLLPGEKSIAMINYQNVGKVYFRVIEIPKEIFQMKPERRNSNEIQQYLSRKVVAEWSQELSDWQDYQMHSAEIDFKAMESGYYILIGSLEPEFNTANNILSSNRFYVSNWAYFFESGNQEKTDFYVVDRKSGKPLKDVQVNRYVEEYNYQRRVTQYNNAGTFTTDSEGKVTFNVEGDSKSYHLLLVGKSDSLKVSSPIYLRETNRLKKVQKKSQIFTDRNIYRPGQNLYFKGVKWTQEEYELKLSKSENVTVNLIDVNGQKISSLTLVTNEFGTYHGVFPLPSSGLTGRYVIEDGTMHQAISIEQYKRPNFTVSTEPVEGVISFNSTVAVEGKAEQFNGLALSNAKGTFRVIRENHIKHYRYYWFPRPAGDKTEISNGEFVTDEKGQFTIEFTAIPDGKSINQEDYRANYTIEMSVTDLNGETQGTKAQVVVGKKSMYLQLSGKDKLTSEELSKGIKVSSHNLQGQKLPAEVEIVLKKLKIPEKPIRSRYWNDPEFKLSENSEVFCPNGRDNDFLYTLNELEIGDMVESIKINTAEVDMVSFEGIGEGAFVIIAKATDPAGYEIEEEKRVLIYNKSGSLPMPLYIWTQTENDRAKVGEKIYVNMSDFRKGAYVKYRVWNKYGLQYDSWIVAGPKPKKLEYQINEEDRGQVVVQLYTVADNRQYTEEIVFEVPYDNKKLDVRLETFKNEMKPGNEEKWKIIVTKNLREVQKETDLLVSMYDISLDEIKKHQWSLNPYQFGVRKKGWITGNNFSAGSSREQSFFEWEQFNPGYRQFHELNWFGYRYYGAQRFYEFETAEMSLDGGEILGKSAEPMAKNIKQETAANAEIEEDNSDPSPMIRDDFRETAFFYPEVMYNKEGLGSFSFRVPDALTGWKFQMVAISKEFEYGYLCDTFVTKKELESKLNLPRFITTGDEIVIQAKISNLTDKQQSVSVQLLVKDNEGNDLSDILISNQEKVEIKSGGSASASWKMKGVDHPGKLEFTFKAQGGKHTDGIRKSVSVVSSKVFVTDTYPVSLNGGESKTVKVDRLKESTVDKESLSIEYTADPVWYVVQTLPYLADIGNESNGQIFNRFYANALGLSIIDINPSIEKVFEKWKTEKGALESQLSKNQEFKSADIEDTPWLQSAMTEKENKAKIALFFDRNNMKASQKAALYELFNKQESNGAWAWFKGMRDNRHITQRIVLGFSKLNEKGVYDVRNSDYWPRLDNAIRYLDQRILEDYNFWKEKKLIGPNHTLGVNYVEYWYLRTQFENVPMDDNVKEAFDYIKARISNKWLSYNKYLQAMIALSARSENSDLSNKILTSLEERAIEHPELGVYWKKQNSYAWHQSEILKQSLIIEAFSILKPDHKYIDQMKIWLIKQKQTHMWNNGTNTTEACWALLSSPGALEGNNSVTITFSEERFTWPESGSESGSGYTKKKWGAAQLENKEEQIIFKNEGDNISWGAVYFQYWQNSDEVESTGNALQIEKKIMLKRPTEKGPELIEYSDEMTLETSDQLMVRLIFSADRDMEFVHLKDMHASGLEQGNQLSGYKWSSNFGYYSSVTDMAHHFYIDWLPRGKYLIDYPMVVNNDGEFSAGFSTIQSFYAPEFSARSEGSRIKVSGEK